MNNGYLLKKQDENIYIKSDFVEYDDCICEKFSLDKECSNTKIFYNYYYIKNIIDYYDKKGIKLIGVEIRIVNG